MRLIHRRFMVVYCGDATILDTATGLLLEAVQEPLGFGGQGFVIITAHLVGGFSFLLVVLLWCMNCKGLTLP